jgi:hypothetical protein
MQMRAGLFLGILAGALAGAALYKVARTDRAAESPGEPALSATPNSPGHQAEDLYCVERIASGGVIVNMGSDCPVPEHEDSAESARLTITREADALVITGSDP